MRRNKIKYKLLWGVVWSSKKRNIKSRGLSDCKRQYHTEAFSRKKQNQRLKNKELYFSQSHQPRQCTLVMAKHTVYLASECHRSVTVVESDPCVICVSDTPISHITKTSYRWTLVFSAGKLSHLPTLQPRQTEAHSKNHCQYPSGTQHLCQSYCCGWSVAAQQLHRCTVHSVYVHVCYCTICMPSCSYSDM